MVSITADYERDGYVFPLRAFSADEALTYRRELERIEGEHEDTPNLARSLGAHCHLVMPFVDEIMRRESVLGPVSALIGPDLLVWGCTFWIKDPQTPHFVSWHQDLTYWGLDAFDEVTAWIALSPATIESGCMRFVPGSHARDIVAHRDTHAADNLLSRGQEVAVEVDEARAVDVVLAPGEMSLHHGRMFHASNPNRSPDRRIGLAIRYITPQMRQSSGARTVAALVKGEDRFGHFELSPPPSGALHADDVERVRRAKLTLNEILYS